MKSLGKMIKDYLDSASKELSELLESKNIDVEMSLEGTFSRVQSPNLYITLLDSDYDTEDFRFNEVTFEIPFIQFEIYKDCVLKFLVECTETLDIVNNFNSKYKFIQESYDMKISYRPQKPIKEIMTFAEATQKWGLGESTLRSMARDGRLTEGIDYRKSGKVWLITEAAMRKLYGDPK